MKKYLISKIPEISKISKIRGEASLRSFYRYICLNSTSKIAMVYPQENKSEIERIAELTKIYKKYRINVPEVLKTLENRIVLLEDLGNISFQQAFRKSNLIQKKKLLGDVSIIISKLHKIPISYAKKELGTKRLKMEMDFFLKYFIQDSISRNDKANLKKELYLLVENISTKKVFTHRDFHSRNMQYFKDKIYLIDSQDSLLGSYYYDIVSFANDSYLDLGKLRPYFYSLLEEKNIRMDMNQIDSTSLQRNIKALGTFGYQINIRGNLSYKKYIKRTLCHIRNNPQAELIYSIIKNTSQVYQEN